MRTGILAQSIQNQHLKEKPNFKKLSIMLDE